ncbi:MAG: carbohydrate-binding protein [Agathobacter sp.]
MLTWKIQNKSGDTKMVAHGEREVGLVYTNFYEEGDMIVLELAEKGAYVWVQVDESLGSSLLYMTGNMYFHIPFGDKRISYSPNAFSGSRHYMYARYTTETEIRQYRNLAVNVNDQHENDSCFPHASANVETRGEAVFAARNAIDGITENHAHGEWPYASWGINRREDACFRLDFGRSVLADKLVIYERADFPHDNWWKQITVAFSDGTEMVCELIKTDQGQEISFPEKKIEWLELKELIKSDEPSPFPALSQIQVFGTELV